MTLQNLFFFNEIIKDMNLSVTAARLFSSQQALSGHIKRLENHFGVKLFERKPNLVLTREGKALAREAKVILDAESRLFIEYGTGIVKTCGTIKIACGLGRSKYFLPEAISRFSNIHPYVAVICEDENKFRNANMFNDDRIDLAIGRKLVSSPNISSTPLFNTSSSIVASRILLQKYFADDTDSFIKRARDGIELCDIPREIPIIHTGMPGQYHWICDVDPELRNHQRIMIDSHDHELIFSMCIHGRAMIIISDLFLKHLISTYSESIMSNVVNFLHLYKGQRILVPEVLSYNAFIPHPKYFFDFISILSDVLVEKNLIEAPLNIKKPSES